MKKKSFMYANIVLACVLCGIAGWYVRVFYISAQSTRLIEIRENDADYRYINPLLLVDTQEESPEYSSLKKLITNYIKDVKATGEASSTSVYFRDLNLGKWMGVNENVLYDPSSMLKVAVMIGYFKKADKDPSVLLKELYYKSAVDSGQYYKPEHPLLTGLYTIRDINQAMIVDSDNTALEVLYNNDRQAFVDVLKSLQIPPPLTTSQLDFMSPKTYSGLFRTLFSATYLSKPLSEQALQFLTYTTFKKGLVAGVLSGTIVAHKFGEHTYTFPNGTIRTRQLHDCGIIYYPGHPYFLCVMTDGQDFGNLEKIISDISRIVYTDISITNGVQNK